MLAKLTPEKAITISRLSVLLACCWPLSPDATKIQILLFKILRVGNVFSAVLLILPLLYATYLHREDSVIFVKSVCLTLAAFQVILQTLYTATQYQRLQNLIEEMKLFCKEAKQHERNVLQEYVDKYSTFYGVCIAWFYVSACAVILGTLLLSQPFPTNAEYPFPVDSLLLRCIIFLHQSYVGFQCAAQLCINSVAALLLWFAAARFKILMVELRLITDISSLIQCIQKHEEIRRYAVEVTVVTRIIALMIIAFTGSVVILSGLTIIGKQAFTVKVQFCLLSAAGLLEVFMCAWPADHLMNISMDVTTAAYESPWYLQPLYLQKQLLCVLMPQKPITISVSCIMPTLSLNYYCSYLSNAFSAFTALRVTLTDEDEN